MMNYSVTKNNKMLSLGLIAFGVAGIAYGFATDHTRVWASLLHSNFYLLAVALAGLIMLTALSPELIQALGGYDLS